MQHTLSFKHKTNYLEEDFIVSPSNNEAFNWMRTEWNTHCSCIYGETGKTHLGHIWAKNNDAVFLDEISMADVRNTVLDNADMLNEVELFHLYNTIKEQGKLLLLLAKTPPAKWGIQLPDLKSRLGSIPTVCIAPPDDMLIEALLIKHFSDRQLRVGKQVITYIVSRIERTFNAVDEIVEQLDTLSLAEKREITIPLVKRFL